MDDCKGSSEAGGRLRRPKMIKQSLWSVLKCHQIFKMRTLEEKLSIKI